MNSVNVNAAINVKFTSWKQIIKLFVIIYLLFIYIYLTFYFKLKLFKQLSPEFGRPLRKIS